MSNSLWMLVTLSIALLLLSGVTYYVITRWITLFGGTFNYKLMFLISLLIAIMVMVMNTAQFVDTAFFSVLGSLGSWLFMFLPLLAVFLGIEHLGRAVVSLWGNPTGSLLRWFLTLWGVVVVFAYGISQALTTKITETTIVTNKLTRDLNLMFVADLHVDDMLSTLHLQELRKQIELQQPDLVLIAGDFFNRASVRQTKYYQLLSGLEVPIYAVEGNHDTMGDLLALKWIEDLTNIKFLYNESIVLPDFNLQLIGIKEKGQRQKDWVNEAVWTVTLQVEGKDNTWLSTVLKASKIKDWPTFNILLTHQPIWLRKLSDFPIDLEVAGHTHKLQIRGLHFLSYLINDYTYGKYEENGKIVFVTQGIWTWGLPVRLWTRSEIVMMHLLHYL